jgi:hypothetical protein
MAPQSAPRAPTRWKASRDRVHADRALEVQCLEDELAAAFANVVHLEPDEQRVVDAFLRHHQQGRPIWRQFQQMLERRVALVEGRQPTPPPAGSARPRRYEQAA